MGILDLYINPPDLEIKTEHLKKLRKGKSKAKRLSCIHAITYEKWIHRGRKPGVPDTFHYKEVCKKCGYRKNVPRTKEIFELVKDQKWRSKKK